MSGPNVATQVADLCTLRRAVIAARKRELITELRRLCDEEARLELAQLGVGVETAKPDLDRLRTLDLGDDGKKRAPNGAENPAGAL